MGRIGKRRKARTENHDVTGRAKLKENFKNLSRFTNLPCPRYPDGGKMMQQTLGSQRHSCHWQPEAEGF
jgi:hypothetical protein